MKHKILLVTFLFVSLAFVSCEKSNYESVTSFKVRLSSGSFNADQFNVNITGARVLYSDKTEWVPLNTPSQLYNVLEFQNGFDTLIAEGTLPATSIVEQLQLVIGSGNTIQLGGKTLPLSTKDPETVLTLVLKKKLNRQVETINLVFDPTLSISPAADGSYQFKPVISLEK